MRRRLPAWVLGGLLMLLSGFVGSAFRTGWQVGAAFVVAALIVAFRLRWRGGGQDESERISSTAGTDGELVTPRWYSWPRTRQWLHGVFWGGLFVITVLATVGWRMSEARSGVTVTRVGVDSVAHAALFLSFLVWMLTLSGGHMALLPLSLSILLCGMAAGGGGGVLVTQVAFAMAGGIGFVVASQIILRRVSGDALDVAGPVTRSSWSSLFGGGLNNIVLGVVLCGVLITTSVMARVTHQALPEVQQRVVQYVTDTLERRGPEAGVSEGRYVTGSQFGAMRTQMLISPQGLALRGYSDSPPGYLRGSVFGHYDDRRWTNRNPDGRYSTHGGEAEEPLMPQGPGTAARTTGGQHRLRRFQLTEPTTERASVLEIHGVPSKGAVIFTPLASRWIEAAAVSLEVSPDGVVLSGVDIRAPYIVGVTDSVPLQPLRPERQEYLLRVPPELGPVTGDFAEQLCSPQSTVKAKAGAVARFFQDFDYSLDYFPQPGRTEPIEHFLRNRHPAHCEYFATATALILRQAGVPTRYATGYVMSERDERDGSWIARNGNAHAWVEAYDEASGQWFPVESTPGRAYETLQGERDEELAAGDARAGATADSARGEAAWYQRWWQWMRTIQVNDVLFILFRGARIPLLVLLIVLLWLMFRWRPVARLDPIDLRSHRMLHRVDRKLRRHALVRANPETLHQFADRVDAAADEMGAEPNGAALHQAARWYRTYASARYRGREPQPL